MEDLLRSLAQRPEPWTAGEIVLYTTIAFLLGLSIAWVYRATNRQLTVSFSFINTLVLVSMIMSLVMMVIGNNIARAFGLAGAMSIIRFRTVVKDTRDTAFVFFALGAGMATGTGNLKIALLGTMLVVFFIGVLHWTRHGAVGQDRFMLSFDTDPGDDGDLRKVYGPVLDRYLQSYRLVIVKSVRMGEWIKLTFQVEIKNSEEIEALVSELSALEGVYRVTIAHGEEAEG